MKNRACIKSLLLLFAVLFSFSVNAYNSLGQCSSVFNASKIKVNVNAPVQDKATSDNLLFEEQENENGSENAISEAFLVLPFFCYSFSLFESQTPYQTSSDFYQAVEPIFLTIRSIRI